MSNLVKAYLHAAICLADLSAPRNREANRPRRGKICEAITDFFRIGRHVGLKSRAHRVAIYTRRLASRFLGADKSARQIAACK